MHLVHVRVVPAPAVLDPQLVTVHLQSRALGRRQVMKEILGSDKEWMANLKGRN